MNTLLSIIIPIYNGELFINDCLDSIFCQYPENIEIIVVNDGSTDSSRHMIEQYCLKYSNITLINQANNGVSAARNEALNKAKGQYITFLDADDRLDDGFFCNILPQLDECDILEINASYLINSQIMSQPIMNYKNNTILDSQLKKQRFHQQYKYYIALRVVKKSILEHIRFNERISFCEDALFLTECYIKATSIKTLDKNLYHYRQHETNTTHINQTKNIYILGDLLAVIEHKIENAQGLDEVAFIALFLNILHRRKSMQVIHKRTIYNDAITKENINLCRQKDYLKKSQNYTNKIVCISIKYPYLSNILILLKSIF